MICIYIVVIGMLRSICINRDVSWVNDVERIWSTVCVFTIFILQNHGHENAMVKHYHILISHYYRSKDIGDPVNYM